MSNNVIELNEIKDDNVDKCCKFSKPCMSFIIASIISLTTTGFGIALIVSNPASMVLVPLGSSLISSNLAFWVSPPSVYAKDK